MRTPSAGLLAHYESGSTTLAWGLKITRADAQVFGFTSHQRDVVLSGVTYLAGPGLDVSSLAMSAGFGVDNAELTILADDTTFTVASLLSGRWDGAAFEVFRFNYADLTQGRDVLMRGNLGNVTPRSGAFVVELRGLQQYLQQPVGEPSTKTCRARLGDSRCAKNLTAFTHTGTVTGVTSSQVFADSSRTEADDYFGEGLVTWTGGNNTGLTVKVKLYASATNTFTLMVPMVLPIQVGDTYSAVAGCRKRLEEDCRDKFSNVLNFQGEPHRPSVDDVTSTPDVDVQ